MIGDASQENIGQTEVRSGGCRRRPVIGAARIAPIAIALLAIIGTTSACSVLSSVRRIAGSVEANRTAVDAFTKDLESTASTAFEATYVSTGASPATIVYAVRPPRGVAFTDTSANGSLSAELIANSSGEFSCSAPSAPGGSSTCTKLDGATATASNQLYDLYTPQHWVGFLKGITLAAGLAGQKVSSSTMTVNGFPMSCLELNNSAASSEGTICTTAQGLLGYVKIASEPTSFEIKAYSTDPPTSLFELPAGAKVTTVQTPSTE